MKPQEHVKCNVQHITSSTSKSLQTGALFETYTPVLLPPHFQGCAIILAKSAEYVGWIEE